jgi:protein ImuB
LRLTVPRMPNPDVPRLPDPGTIRTTNATAMRIATPDSTRLPNAVGTRTPNSESWIPLYACLYQPPVAGPFAAAAAPAGTLAIVAAQFSPRYECHSADLVSIDVGGLQRLLGPAAAIGDELRRDAAARGVRAHVAVASTRIAAVVAAIARPGVTIVARGNEAEALAPIAIGILEKIGDDAAAAAASAVPAFRRWGLKTLGDLAALPPADLAARLGRPALALQAIARGEDVRPLVPTLADERFDASLDLEWPIEELEPLSFVLTRLLEPLSLRLERRDRGAAALHVLLRLVTREVYARRLELPSPMRDVRTLRTLALLDLDSHPPAAPIDRVTIVIDPTPGRILQHTLFTRAHPTPEQLSTLAARLGAVMGQDRFGAPAVVDSYRPGAFAMEPFKTDRDDRGRTRRTRGDQIVGAARSVVSAQAASAVEPGTIEPRPSDLGPRIVSALRRCRQPVPARVVVADGRPVRVTTDRRGFAGGAVAAAAGPWRTSGHWWAGGAGQPPGAGPPGQAWDRDEWDVSLTDGAVYRVFRDRETDAWFVDAVVD